jgi:hypothetical protein
MTKAKPTIKIHNVQTGEIIERDMTADEIAEVEAVAQIDAEIKAEAESKAARRQEILEKLGLTNDEAQLLLG